MEQITVPALIGYLNEIFVFVESAARIAGMDDKQQNSLKIAVEEIFVNIASYAYSSGEGDVTVRFSYDQEKLVFEFEDSGLPYDPLAKSDPDISLSVDEREIGGLGVFMVKKLMDNLEYRYEEGKNILTIEKYL